MTSQSTPREAQASTESRSNGKGSEHPAPKALTFEDRVAEQLATWFGCGRVPRAPGTAGAIGALPLHFVLSRLGPVPHALAVLGVTAVGTWAAQRHAERLGEKDPQSIVIDEVAGTLIAMGLVRRRSLGVQLAALVLFRAFDITKPGLVDRVQHVKPIGLGIMADDVVAGVLAGVASRWLRRK
jgi:phosphatidylglycerophosphatase A